MLPEDQDLISADYTDYADFGVGLKVARNLDISFVTAGFFSVRKSVPESDKRNLRNLCNLRI
jgi:hypothetical protein